MMSEISNSESFTVTFEQVYKMLKLVQFRAMRVLNKLCDLNVIAEFKKFDVHRL